MNLKKKMSGNNVSVDIKSSNLESDLKKKEDQIISLKKTISTNQLKQKE